MPRIEKIKGLLKQMIEERRLELMRTNKKMNTSKEKKHLLKIK